jgi:outer membrane protein OmpA-like peptidoglycan-associated protein
MEPRKFAQEGLAMLNLSKLTAILSIVTVSAVLTFGIGKAVAGDITEDQIVKALTPVKKPLTRGLSMAPVEDPAKIAKETAFVQSIRGRTTRSLSNNERQEIADQIVDKPNIDLEINFDYNSAEISSKSLPAVQALGRALTNPSLTGSTFIVAGHTDAAGGDNYNQELSDRRADSIKRYLMDNYHISSADLVTVGYGKTKLKDPSQPLSEVNRRVQVVNMANKTTASQ